MVNPDIHSLNEIFSQLSPDDEEALIALPYRAGLFVSFSDVTGGWEAQEREIQSLTSILREYSEDFCKTEFSQKVLMDCLRARAQWPGWSHNIDTVPAQADRLMILLAPMLSDKELNAFREVLIDIAVAVALAFREEREAREKAENPSILKNLLLFFSGGKEDVLAHANVSRAEKEALAALCTALKYTRVNTAYFS